MKAADLQLGESGLRPAFRMPKRVSITLADSTDRLLVERSTGEGRSLSNLASCLLERALKMCWRWSSWSPLLPDGDDI